MSERRITRRQALLAGGSALAASALGAGATRTLGGGPAAPLQARGDFLPLVGTHLRAMATDGSRARLTLAEVADLRHAPKGSADAFELLLHGPVDLDWSSDVLELHDHRGRSAHLLVSRSALPRRGGGQQYSAIINGTTLGQEV